MFGVPSRVMPMNATLAPLKFWIEYGGNSVLPRGLVDHVGGEELEVGATEAVAVEATVDRVAATVLHPQELGGPLVELVVADGIEIESDLIHCFDGRLVVEQARQQGAGADQVTGRHDDRVAVRLLECLHVRRQVLGAAGERGRC